MPIQELPLIGGFAQARFRQFGSQDSINWYVIDNPESKKKQAMYPALGRKVQELSSNYDPDFDAPVRAMYRTKDFAYFVVNDRIWRIGPPVPPSTEFIAVDITAVIQLPTTIGDIWFTYIIKPGGQTVAVFADGTGYFNYDESTNIFTDETAAVSSVGVDNPLYLASLGNRIIVSQRNNSLYAVSASQDPAEFAEAGGVNRPFTNTASDKIEQLGVLHNTLYIF